MIDHLKDMKFLLLLLLAVVSWFLVINIRYVECKVVRTVLINELLVHTLPDQLNWLEIYNPMVNTINITGWMINSRQTIPSIGRVVTVLLYTFPNNTVLVPGAFLVLNDSATGYRLPNEGGELLLEDEHHNTIHNVKYVASPLGISYGIYNTSDLKYHFVLLSSPTMGGPNSSPFVGEVVVCEVMYWPIQGELPFVVIQNLKDKEVRLFFEGDQWNDPAPLDTYQLRGSLKYNFPQQTILGPKRKLIVSSVNSTVFRTAYSVPSWVQVFGPWMASFNLSSFSTKLSLQAPGQPGPFGKWIYYNLEEMNIAFKLPWPTGAIATGASIVRINTSFFSNEPTNWKTSYVRTFYERPPQDGWVQPALPLIPSKALKSLTIPSPLAPFGPNFFVQSEGIIPYLIFGFFVVLVFGCLILSFVHQLYMTTPKAAPTEGGD